MWSVAERDVPLVEGNAIVAFDPVTRMRLMGARVNDCRVRTAGPARTVRVDRRRTGAPAEWEAASRRAESWSS